MHPPGKAAGDQGQHGGQQSGAKAVACGGDRGLQLLVAADHGRHQAVAAQAGVPVLAVAGLADLLAFTDGNDTLAGYRAPLQAYRARYGCAPTG